MLEWIKDYAPTLTLLATVIGGTVGGAIALYQWGKQIRIRRTEFVYQVMKDLRLDAEIIEISHRIAYGEFQYDESFKSNHELEIQIDKLLGVLNYHCYLLKSRAIAKQDFNVFKYQIIWTLSDKDVQAYIKNQARALPYLVGWGLRNDLFPDDFLLPLPPQQVHQEETA